MKDKGWIEGSKMIKSCKILYEVSFPVPDLGLTRLLNQYIRDDFSNSDSGKFLI